MQRVRTCLQNTIKCITYFKEKLCETVKEKECKHNTKKECSNYVEKKEKHKSELLKLLLPLFFINIDFWNDKKITNSSDFGMFLDLCMYVFINGDLNQEPSLLLTTLQLLWPLISTPVIILVFKMYIHIYIEHEYYP